MTHIRLAKFVITIVSFPFASLFSAVNAAEMADTVYTNGKIYTVNEVQPWAEAVAIKDGKFIAVGSSTDVAALIGDGAKVIDLMGGFAMPGIHDTHVHPTLVYTY